MKALEDFLNLTQSVEYLDNIEKINECGLGPVNGANNLDAPQQIRFSRPRDGKLIYLADSYLEVTFTYNTLLGLLMTLLILHLRMMLLAKCLIQLN